ncbi:hypothetical protein [Gimesia chilikensis]|nr:hypothetical protein [Gimesia chilikensis]
MARPTVLSKPPPTLSGKALAAGKNQQQKQLAITRKALPHSEKNW